MLSIKEQLVLLYCTTDDLLKKQARGGEWRESNNKPKFTDAEVLVISLMHALFSHRHFEADIFIGQSQ